MENKLQPVSAGTLDPSFGKQGVLEFPVPAISALEPLAILNLPNNKLLVALSLVSEEGGIAIARLHENGTFDLEFGENKHGFVEVLFDGLHESTVWGLTPLADGGWLVLGQYSKLPAEPGFPMDGGLFLVRQRADGSLDASFGQNGIQLLSYFTIGYPEGKSAGSIRPAAKIFNAANQVTSGVGVVEQPDGKIVLATNTTNTAAPIGMSGVVLRLNLDGSYDKTFNKTGYATIKLAGINHSWSEARGVAVQADGRVLVCGHFARKDFSPLHAFVTRLTSEGRVDTDFNNGQAVTVFEPKFYWHTFNAITVRESDGMIVAVGEARRSEYRKADGLIVALNPSGSFNLIFNDGKPLFSDPHHNGVLWRGCRVQKNGALIVVGITGNGYVGEELSAITARYLSNGTLDRDFNGGQGYTVYLSDQGFTATKGMALYEDGRITVNGISRRFLDDSPLPIGAGGWVVRYLA
ncbi:delta-60 repeat domain-containing protein [Pseudomonas frederiksbergensis]|uniref:Delta-60 repeat domain-containing protein n=1 Tax=Pseudomonas frederiksbergensis TaxID=104087 RepID=A0A423K618_9PSED|nr:delta-60 repeat domain-containing protein [Pseudomonas frederiksbergensis]RON47125.1 hypothetical protein BK665_26550 [Pseudomonas frederiksbergensis]